MRLDVGESVELLLRRTATATDIAYLNALVAAVAELTDTGHVFVGRVTPVGADHSVRTLAYFHEGVIVDGFEYTLRDTPCAHVTDGVVCQFPRGVADLYPHDEMLREMGIEAYFGIPITAAGASIGILVALDRYPRQPIEGLEEVFGLFADRAAAEILRMEADAALEASEARYRQFVTQCAEGVWSIDADNLTDFVNPQMAAMLGLEPDEMLGRPLTDFMDDEARASAARNLERRRSGIIERHPFRLRHKSGRDVFTEMATNPIVDADGAYQGALALVTDVSDRNQVAQNIQQSEKLESLGRLAGGIAHDFNNLLVGILTNVEVIEHAPVDSDVARRSREAIRDASLRASQLTKQLLSYAGRGSGELEPVSIGELIEEMGAILRSSIAPGVTLRIAVDGDLPPALGDSGQLSQVLLNLVVNANDALDPGDGGVIDVRALLLAEGDQRLARSPVTGELGVGPYVAVEVEDSGAGMSKAVLRRIFDPYFSTKEHGHGLGLAAVLGILERHDGGIQIDTEPGRGSLFRVLLPLAARAEDEPAAVEVPAPTSWIRGKRILLVDDQDLVRSALRSLLIQEGADVDEATDGAEGLAKVRERDYDLVFADLTMPKLDGIELAREVRDHGGDVPIVLMSGYLADELPLDTGLVFLEKPFRRADLLSAIDHAIGAAGGATVGGRER